MALPILEELPPEIILAITDRLTCDDKKALSLASKTLRKHVAADLFKHIKTDCPLPDHHILQSILDKYGAIDPTSGKETWYWNDSPASVWARNLADVPAMQRLLQCEGLPNCTTLSVFTTLEDAAFGIPHGLDVGRFLYARPETWDQVKENEVMHAWRQASAELWSDIARFFRGEGLELINLLPRYVAGRMWQANVMEGFNSTISEMPTFIYNHANRLECLNIAADKRAHLGKNALRLTPHTMPQLKTLRLENLCITSSLKEFLGAPSPSLESLYLYGCAASGYEESSPEQSHNPTWADFWETVRKNNPSLKEVLYQNPRSRQLHDGETIGEDENSIVWPYVELGFPYGDVRDCKQVNRQRLAAGDDDREFQLLMEEIARRQQITLY
ncbi:hypothetical protein FHETE_6913 [Fusarium heterosporum]|uniref:F-box domain-containing protein n=1 Tax=Fusarium heterosporum TaxID=42747 RepID=A0A8H5T848_FUSHE|nr:hypothetical protein FHETE_6913 [Fusarium heterosporum]